MNGLSLAVGRSSRIAAVVALAALMLLAPAGLAQTPVSEGDMGDAPHPVHIHAGSCAELGDVVVPLTDVTYAPEGEHVGSDAAHAVKTSITHVDMPLDDIIGGEYAINVHKSAEEIDVYIACGDIGGTLVTDAEDGDREVWFGLAEQNDSGHTGSVLMSEEDGQTEVTIILIEPDEMQ